MFRNSLLGSTILRNKPDDGGAPAPAPVAAQPAAAPVVDAPATVAEPSPAPAAEPAPAVPAETAKVDAHATETLLEGAGKEPAAAADPAKTAAPAAEPAKPAEVAKSEGEVKPPEAAPAAAPVYDLKLPEGITAPPEALTAYTEMLATNKIAPEVGQAFLDRHVAEMTRYADHVAQEQHRAFSETRAGWRDLVTSDPELGGAGHKTAMTAIASVRDQLVPKSEEKAFNEFLRITGAGDHPQFLKMMHRAAKILNEPAPPAVLGNPPPTNGQRPGGRNLKQIYAATDPKRAVS